MAVLPTPALRSEQGCSFFTATQNLGYALDFFFPTDYGVELVVFRCLCEVSSKIVKNGGLTF